MITGEFLAKNEDSIPEVKGKHVNVKPRIQTQFGLLGLGCKYEEISSLLLFSLPEQDSSILACILILVSSRSE